MMMPNATDLLVGRPPALVLELEQDTRQQPAWDAVPGRQLVRRLSRATHRLMALLF